eukprot:CAMPEP_0171897546 /NCGR_PEP_ID=MMETSP0992-20121227/48198_1 /TAXON_ID=483369 /ORGANISM="non described non described, Strain CCMP2098" /LENGTH=392 /DNA_ID=CAMNT_0012525691 /DNA_START=8 /DNA_END=1186 /DNA_ORIENTATION=+
MTTMPAAMSPFLAMLLAISLATTVKGWQPARTSRLATVTKIATDPNDPLLQPIAFKGSSFVSDSCWRAEGLQCIDEYNEDLLEVLDELRQQPFFRYYSVDLLKGCNYFPQDIDECSTQSCEIYPVDTGVVPKNIEAVDAAEYDFELDAWVRWDMPSDDYYDLFENREKYTGRDFNRAVNGLHSSISAHIVHGMLTDEAKHPVTGEPLDAHAEYERRLGRTGENPCALEHLYFGYMLCLCAVREATERLEACDFGLDNDGDEDGVRGLVSEVLMSPLLNNPGVLVAESRLRAHAANSGGGNLWQARLRTRDLLRIMDCVQCNVCRLHGKVGSLGLATALQVLLGAEGRGGDSSRLHRVEIAALISSLGKFANAIQIIKEFETAKTEAEQLTVE